jgi:hypothetical protein
MGVISGAHRFCAARSLSMPDCSLAPERMRGRPGPSSTFFCLASGRRGPANVQRVVQLPQEVAL